MPGRDEFVVWRLGDARSRWSNSVACAGINPSVRNKGIPAQEGTIYEEQVRLGTLPGFRNFSFRSNTRFGSVDWRCEFAARAAARYCGRSEDSGARECGQGDSNEGFHA